MLRPASTELQFAFDALILKTEGPSNSDDLKNSKEIDCFLNMRSADFRKNDDMFNLIMDYKTGKHSLLELINTINDQYETHLFWNLNRQEDYDINEIRTYALNLNWFWRLFFPNELMTQLSKFDPYSPNGSKADDVFAAYNQPNDFIDASLYWIGKYLLSGLKNLESLMLERQSSMDDDSSTESRSSISDSASDDDDDDEAPIENETPFLAQQTQQDVVYPALIHRVRATIIRLEKCSLSEVSDESRNDPGPSFRNGSFVSLST